jgi:hypothetical protein
LVPALNIAYLVLQHRLSWGRGTIVASAMALAVAVGIAVTLAGKLGLRLLYFVTLIPVVLAVAALIRIGSPQWTRRFPRALLPGSFPKWR